MPSRSEVSYFGAGPAPLPTPILESAAASLLNHENSGLGLGEISHRSPTANKIIADAKSALVHLLSIPEDEYEIIFMQGGGSGEFSAVLQNLVVAWVERRRQRAVKELGEGKDAEVLERVRKEVESELQVEYLVTGSWSLKASQEAARLIGKRYVKVLVDARQGKKFGTFPDEGEWKGELQTTKKGGSALTYFCDNETVDGVEFPKFPTCLEGNEETEGGDERIVVADMSSNFLSRKVDVRRYGVIFAGAQKNLGLPGITLVIIRKSLLALTTSAPIIFLHALSDLLPNTVPAIVFDFATLAKNNSLYNTLPVFNLYVATLVLQSLVSKYGDKRIAGQEEIADRKAQQLYGVLDKYSNVYNVVPDKKVRSRMNVCFRVKGGDEEVEKKFVKGAEGRGLLGVKGHRSVGGIRVSNYNAVGEEAVGSLCKFLEEFAEGES